MEISEFLFWTAVKSLNVSIMSSLCGVNLHSRRRKGDEKVNECAIDGK